MLVKTTQDHYRLTRSSLDPCSPVKPCLVKPCPASGQDACRGGWRVTQERGMSRRRGGCHAGEGDVTQERGMSRRRGGCHAGGRPITQEAGASDRRVSSVAGAVCFPARTRSFPPRWRPFFSVAALLLRGGPSSPWRPAFRVSPPRPRRQCPAWWRSAPGQHACSPMQSGVTGADTLVPLARHRLQGHRNRLTVTGSPCRVGPPSGQALRRTGRLSTPSRQNP